MKYFNLHTHQYSNQPDVLELVNQYPQEFDPKIPFYSIGIHPLFIDENRLESDLLVVDEKLGMAECLALGECGLDKRSETQFELQQTVFEKQLAMAEKHQKPVVIHCVAAFQELIEIKKRLKIYRKSLLKVVQKLSKQLLLSRLLREIQQVELNWKLIELI